jgi:hypothetical protein
MALNTIIYGNLELHKTITRPVASYGSEILKMAEKKN